MFERPKSAAIDRLRGAAEARAQAEVDEAVAIAELAAEQGWNTETEFDVIGTRPVRIGADGTPAVSEFLPLEVAALKGISVGAATWLIRDIVNLQARHPLLWGQIRHGRIPVFRAAQLAAEVARAELTFEEARDLDLAVSPKVGVLAWARVLRLTRGLIATIAADRLAARAERARAARFVRKLATDDPMVSVIAARVDTADAIFFDAAVDRIADILHDRGDGATKEVLRAKAVGILATPARAQLMLAEACGAADAATGAVRSTDPRLLPKARGTADQSCTGCGVPGRAICCGHILWQRAHSRHQMWPCSSSRPARPRPAQH